MKAPDKIYIDKDCDFNKHDSFIAWSYKPPFASVEYIRKDALLERMKERRQHEMENGEEGTLYRCGYADGRVNMLDDLIEDFNSL